MRSFSLGNFSFAVPAPLIAVTGASSFHYNNASLPAGREGQRASAVSILLLKNRGKRPCPFHGMVDGEISFPFAPSSVQETSSFLVQGYYDKKPKEFSDTNNESEWLAVYTGESCTMEGIYEEK